MAAGVCDMHTALSESAMPLLKLCSPPLLSAEMVWSTNYTLKCCNPPEVAASIKLSWGQLMVAASLRGDLPRLLVFNPPVCFDQTGDAAVVKFQPIIVIFSLISAYKTFLKHADPPSTPLSPYRQYRSTLFALPAVLPTLSHFLLREGVNKAIRE